MNNNNNTTARSSPWQYEWKRPEWTNPTSNETTIRGTPLHTASAEVVPEECSNKNNELSLQNLTVNNNNNATSFVLTVTLFCMDKKKHSNKRHHTIGDAVVLELFQHSKTDTTCSIKRRLLRWPSSALITESEQEDEVVVKKPSKKKWPWSKEEEDYSSEYATPAGLVSLSLCRRPCTTTEEDSAAAVDAMDVINFMSLNVDGNNNEIMAWKAAAPIQKKSSSTAPEAPPTELVLACLTTGGQVHFYLPLDMLLHTVQDNKQDMSSGFSEFIFGSNLFHELQQSLIPLSEPIATVVLSSVLLGAGSIRKLEKIIQEEEESMKPPAAKDKDEQSEEEEEDVGFSLPMWDSAAWDANVEPSTAVYRTRENVPEITVNAFGYVAVAGRGIRARKRRVSSSKKMKPRAEPDDGAEEQKVPEWAVENEQDKKFHWLDYLETGGFVTFISLRHYSETRTVYLPFAPKHLSPIVWGDMCFVLVLGDELSAPTHRPLAMMIRVDSSNVTRVPRGRPPPVYTTQESDMSAASSSMTKRESEEKLPTCSIKRFHPLPIIFQTEGYDATLRVAAVGTSSMFTSPPCIAMMFAAKKETSVDLPVLVVQTLDKFDLVSDRVARHSMGGHRQQGKLSIKSIPAITTRQIPGHFAQIPRESDTTDLQSVSCSLGQGWALVATQDKVFFVCLEGATVTGGAFVKSIHSNSDERERGLLSDIISAYAFDTVPSGFRRRHSDELDVYKSSANLELPFTSAYKVPSILRPVVDQAAIPEDEELEVDPIVVNALDSISAMHLEDLPSVQALPHKGRSRSFSLTHREKSERLLRQCHSWTMLNDREGSKVLMDGQTPVLTARLGALASDHFILSLRQLAVDNGVATPFNQILAWLSQSEEYFTAASVALDLLRDKETLRDLRRATDDTASLDTEHTTLEGLLDGIIPLYRASNNWRGEEALSPSHAVLTQLADMTIGCLTRGGLAMSSTLENFLRRNTHYDPARASLMLVAATAFCVSDDEESVKSIMGAGYEWPVGGRPVIQDLLWPLRCILQVGSSRDYLSTTLLLINATIPDELRRRRRLVESTETVPSMELCKSIVSMILASADEAPELLLALTDDESHDRYWNSLDHETRLELSLILIDDRYPMLRQSEIRNWALGLLEGKIQEVHDTKGHTGDGKVPNPFLKELCNACFSNAGCDIDALSNKAPESSRSAGVSGIQPSTEADGSQEHFKEQRRARKALRPSPGKGGLDFDLVIPALLLLQYRQEEWRHDNLNTQTLLDAACYLAGRQSEEEPLFALDAPTLMRECAMAGNVSAGANLIGGKDGLVLKCCDILIHGANMTMEDAESFILKENVTLRKPRRNASDADASNFALTDGHRHVLWLLDEHVLSIRTFGEFETIHIRGRVEPVFAARACLRTWWRLSSQDPSSSAWLVQWLRKRLGMSLEDVSRKRLACAALTRALLWPASEHDVGELDPKSDELLANAMSMETLFLVQLCQSCCGLVESVPPSLAEELLRQQQAELLSETSEKSSASRRRSSSRPLQVDV